MKVDKAQLFWLGVAVVTWLLFGCASPATAENRVNIMTGDYDVIPPGYVLRFNKMTGDWAYAPPGAQLELNKSTLEFQYPGAVQPQSTDPVPLEYRQYQYDTQRAVQGLIDRQYERR